MSNINEQLEIYRSLFNVLGLKIGLTRTIILEYFLKIGKGTEFTVPDMINEISLERTLAYAHLRFFHECGFVTIKDSQPLPQGFYEWNFRRRRSYKKRINYSSRMIYIVDFRGVITTIDQRIQTLNDTKHWILDNAEIPSKEDTT